jgi:hypothetical protein
MTRPGTVATHVVLLAALLTGCGDDASDGADAPAGSAPATASSSAAATESPTTTAPATPAEPTVAPATGEQVQAGSYTFVVPEGFTSSGSSSGGLAGAATYTDLTTSFCVIDASEIADVAGTLTFEEAAALQTSSNPDLTRLPDREVGGQQVFAFTSQSETDGTEYLFGRLVDGKVAELSFTFAPEAVRGAPVDPAADQALVESVLATVEWTA